jgi:predicted DNA-binding protein
MSRRKNIHPYLSDELYDRFKKFAVSTGSTESSIVETALSEYLDQTSHRRIVLKRLNTLDAKVERLNRDQTILLETLGTFVNVWMIHNPKLAAGSEDLQRKAAAPRFAAFQKHVARRLSGGQRFVNDIVEEPALPPDENDSGSGQV